MTDWKHKYENIKLLLNRKREESKRFRRDRDRYLSENLRLKNRIIEPICRSEEELKEKLAISTSTRKVYCEWCPHEMDKDELELRVCSICGNKQSSI